MRVRLLLPVTFSLLFLLAGCETVGPQMGAALRDALFGGDQSLSLETIVAGLKEALAVGTQNTVDATSKTGGYNLNPEIRIPVPEKLAKMAGALRKIGLGSQVDKFEGQMNAAAELAAKEAVPVFVDAIKGMSFEDARAILQGNDTAATDYFRARTSGPLTQRYTPIVQTQMNKLGVVTAYEKLEGRYNEIPLVPKVNYQVEDYVVEKALDGLFIVLAGEEKKIRQNPAARTTELLRRVFAGQ